MSVLTLRGAPPERLDLNGITPLALSLLSEAEAARLPVGTSRRGLTLGDCFAIRLDGSADLVIEGGHERLDRVGASLSAGTIRVRIDRALMPGSKTPRPPACQIQVWPGCHLRTSSFQVTTRLLSLLPASQAFAGATMAASRECQLAWSETPALRASASSAWHSDSVAPGGFSSIT